MKDLGEFMKLTKEEKNSLIEKIKNEYNKQVVVIWIRINK